MKLVVMLSTAAVVTVQHADTCLVLLDGGAANNSGSALAWIEIGAMRI